MGSLVGIQMSMQSINGDKMVMLAFPVISTKPRELIVEVIAKQPRVVQDGGWSLQKSYHLLGLSQRQMCSL